MDEPVVDPRYEDFCETCCTATWCKAARCCLAEMDADHPVDLLTVIAALKGTEDERGW